MEFRISDTFTVSLAKLTSDEQAAAKTTAFDLQMNPANPGMQFHKLNRAKDKNFWSIRVNRDIRVIVHRTDKSLLLCFVAHHDPAYRWAERRKIERHPTTGAMQIVEIRERVREIEIPKYVETERPAPPKPLLFTTVPDDRLLAYGVPEEWLEDVKACNEDTLFDLTDHLPAEAAEALLNLATGTTPPLPVAVGVAEDPFAHPDAQRRFRIMTNVEELKQALEYPWERWLIFLHPAQRETVERSYGGPARVAGSAGTGKTVVALHRAAHLARSNAGARILLTTFSIALARNLRSKLDCLIGNERTIRDSVAIRAIDEVAIELFEAAFGTPKVLTPKMLQTLLKSASEAAMPHPFSLHFLESEWNEVVDAWQIDTWEAYRDVPRLGRKTRLGEKQRQTLWSLFDRVRKEMSERGNVTIPMVFAAVTQQIRDGGAQPADFVIVDEAQDISVPQLRFLAAAAGAKEDGLFFAGDLGQRIFQTPFSWTSLGVDVRGRSQTLRINYRTSHQIRQHADRLLQPELADVDGNVESRKGTVSVFNGPEPAIQTFNSPQAECKAIAAWIKDRTADGVLPHEIGIFVRSNAELPRARAAVAEVGLNAVELDWTTEVGVGAVSLCTMHFAKGLEFRAVAVAACDDEIVPLQSRIETVTDDSDLVEVYDTERHLLYVACTRARDYLLITGVDPASEFLEDLNGK